MSEILQTYSKEIISAALVVFGFLLNRIFRLRPKLRYSVRHESFFRLPKPTLGPDGEVLVKKPYVRTVSIFTENSGLQAAKNVEYTFNWRPEVFAMWPGRNYSTQETEDGRWVIRLESLAPKETFLVELLSVNNELPLVTSVRSDEAVGDVIKTHQTPIYPAWFNAFALIVFMLGLATIMYFGLSVAERYFLTTTQSPAPDKHFPLRPGLPAQQP